MNVYSFETISGKVRLRTPAQSDLDSTRYKFLNLNNAEPNLGVPKNPGTIAGLRYALLSNTTDGLAPWRVWSFLNPRIACDSINNSLALGDNATINNNNSFVYSNYKYTNNNPYNSQTFSDYSYGVYSLSGIFLYNATTVGDPASATFFVVTENGFVGVKTDSPNDELTVAGDISARDDIYCRRLYANRQILSAGVDLLTIFTEAGEATNPKYDSVLTTVNLNSAGWESTETSVNSNSANWNSTTTSVNVNSARWNSVFTTVNSNSANYILDGGNSKGTNLLIGTNDAFNVAIETNNTPRINISSSGLVGLGTSLGTEALTVVGNISSSGSLKFPLSSTPPVNTTTPVIWLDVYVKDVLYKLPLYQ